MFIKLTTLIGDLAGAKAIDDFKACVSGTKANQDIKKQVPELKAKGVDVCVNEMDQFVKNRDKSGDSDTEIKLIKDCFSTLFKSSHVIRNC
ncbi:unnamed protein product [Oppiella nova]|uniref:Uncharacterized protein n=1 Tax=Oppiella nova TaxID=334625 RepID=A0A7R9QB41_9ACAR|nr:unnamed protein product [Oppiella nova]CAG2162364.1 unnamed protein product [Oppiella nova]